MIERVGIGAVEVGLADELAAVQDHQGARVGHLAQAGDGGGTAIVGARRGGPTACRQQVSRPALSR